MRLPSQITYKNNDFYLQGNVYSEIFTLEN